MWEWLRLHTFVSSHGEVEEKAARMPRALRFQAPDLLLRARQIVCQARGGRLCSAYANELGDLRELSALAGVKSGGFEVKTPRSGNFDGHVLVFLEETAQRKTIPLMARLGCFSSTWSVVEGHAWPRDHEVWSAMFA